MVITQDKTYFTAIFEIIKMGHALTDGVNTELKTYGITEPQFNVLRILRGRKGEPATVQSVQKDMVQRSSNVTRIIDKLIDKGYVHREQCPSNRRRVDLTITDEGLSALKTFDQIVEAFHAPMKDALTTEESKQLTNLIHKLKTACNE